MEKLLKISVIYCCLAATSRKCKITLYGCHSPSQHRKPSLNFDAVALNIRISFWQFQEKAVSLQVGSGTDGCAADLQNGSQLYLDRTYSARGRDGLCAVLLLRAE